MQAIGYHVLFLQGYQVILGAGWVQSQQVGLGYKGLVANNGLLQHAGLNFYMSNIVGLA